MTAKTAIFFDVGGVLLTNGWDHDARRLAADTFKLDSDFEVLHEKYAEALDIGMISVNMYLDKVVFTKPRDFTKIEFYEFMKNQSVANDEAIEVAAKLSKQEKYLMATVNNESTDLNLYRIERFQLGPIFKMFLSSCYLGVRKPDPAIFIRAMLIANRRSEETIFIDDRAANLDAPKQLGMSVIHFTTAVDLCEELAKLGVDV